MKGDIVNILIPFIAGTAAGIFNYTGLWLTVCKMPEVKRPLLLVSSSFILRTGLILVIFYLVIQGSWQKMVICLVGFLLTRIFFIRYFRPRKQKIKVLTERL